MSNVIWRCWYCGAKRTSARQWVEHKPGCVVSEELARLAAMERHPTAKPGHDPDIEPPTWATPEGRRAYALDHMDDADDYYDERDIVKDWF